VNGTQSDQAIASAGRRLLGVPGRFRLIGGRRGRPACGDDEGMNTAEYAVGTLAAVAFAGLLLKVLTSDAVQEALAAIVQRALQ
jgi:hypothetical protein